MTNYSEHISEELARKLLDWGYPLLSYAPGTYDGAPAFDIPGPDEPGWEDGDRYQIPTYGEVFDWFSRVKGIVISLEPFHTFALKGQIGYTWKLSYLGENPYKLENQIELGANGGAYGGSFKLTADEAIKFAMTLGEKKEKYIEVDINEL
jgi:hypothetical protein